MAITAIIADVDKVEVVVAHHERATLRVGDVFLKIDADQANGVLPTDVVTRNRRVAEAALRPWTPVFTHGDLQVAHVFVKGDEITGVIDWSEATQGDALFDLATLTLGHEERLGDVVAGYGTDVDLDVIRAWWSLRSLGAVRWLVEHGFDPAPEIAVLGSRL
ncbi:phosphotransferase [Nocardiopsis sediminis]|uniref:Phosphotransferase n=1 Tax=Nocardiopsis sediminis TaxID=1778267 RepID=A0ABV8FEH6_9ACTN